LIVQLPGPPDGAKRLGGLDLTSRPTVLFRDLRFHQDDRFASAVRTGSVLHEVGGDGLLDAMNAGQPAATWLTRSGLD